MLESSRLENLRRRVQEDPASIAFAQLAEECRRAGLTSEAVDIARAGLTIHPAYLSARVTLGRALLQMGQVDEAHTELSRVVAAAPENLAALKGLAETYRRQGSLAEALTRYQEALRLAPNDPDLDRIVTELAHIVRPEVSPDVAAAHAERTITALEQWLSAVHVARAQRRA